MNASTHRWLTAMVLILGIRAFAQNDEPLVDSVVPQTFVVLNPESELAAQSFWDNRDFDWYRNNVPFFDCPDAKLKTTFYYRWELLTKHLTYGSPRDGYTFTEFIDRPFWSGTYGAISCPAGHQLYEARWLRSPEVGLDFARYWFRTEGAQPRNYSCWLADGIWALHHVHPDHAAIADILPDIVKNYEGWEDRHWVPESGLFWQTGHDDGMEYNINSRQTADLVRGAPGLRPTLNSYLWADARAIAEMARLGGKPELAAEFQRKASTIKDSLQKLLWDPDRTFFMQRYLRDEQRDGFNIQAGSFTHQTGQFAGSQHGRELIGYVPWQFNLPDPGYEEAWKYLMDSDYFFAEYGPTTVERHDPMFLLSPSCCWWSGQSWPYATTQTLKAMANLLQHYQQDYVSVEDYVKLLQVFANTHRKGDRPYIAEACHPDTGSWEGHDNYNHSEHYFHSGFIDLVITGLVGVQTSSSNRWKIAPLVPTDWDYFALDNLVYQHHAISIVWDRDGTKYGKGNGLQVFIDGTLAASSPKIEKIEVDLPPVTMDASSKVRRANFAVNNQLTEFPRVIASSTASESRVEKLNDGNYWYHIHPPNRWTAENQAAPITVDLEFGCDVKIDEVRLYWLDDEGHSSVRTPQSVRLLLGGAEGWKEVTTSIPVARKANRHGFPIQQVSKIRLEIMSQPHSAVGLTEIECWGPADQPFAPLNAETGNVALRRKGEDYPKASASFTSRYDTVDEAIDGRVGFTPHARNRWTSYESPHDEDWLEVDFGESKTIDRVELGIYDDHGGVKAPHSYRIESWDGSTWVAVSETFRRPQEPTGGEMNEINFAEIKTNKLRVIFRHRSDAKSGITEMRVWEPR